MIGIVCNFFEVTLEELKLKGKRRQPSRVRGILAYIVNETPSLSLTDLGNILHRDISTLSAHASRIKNNSEHDDQLSKDIKIIKELFLK